MHCPKCGDAVEPNEKFCNKCGSPIVTEIPNTNNNSVFVPNEISTTGNMTQPQPLYPNNIQNQINNVQSMQNNIYNQANVHMQTSTPQVPQHKPISPIRKVLAGAGIGIIILLIVFLTLFLVGSSTDYYYSDNSYENDIPTITQKPQTQSKPQSSKQPRTTVIVTDNYYEGVKISTVEDITKLIVQDSVSQKDKCPSTILDIENNLIEKYEIPAVNLCELDIEFAKEINNVFEKIYNEYPVARGVLSNVSVINAKDDGYIAAFLSYFRFALAEDEKSYGIKTQIFLNTDSYFNTELAEKNITNGSKSGRFPPNATLYSAIAHEFGHYLSFISAMKSYGLESIRKHDVYNQKDINTLIKDWKYKQHSLSMLKTAYNNYKKDTNSSLGFDEWRATISKYAVARNNSGEYLYDETVAEAFHDVYLNGNNAKDASKYIIEVLKDELEG